MPGNGKGSSWRHCRLVTSHHATWSCLLSVSNALSTAYLFVNGLTHEAVYSCEDMHFLPEEVAYISHTYSKYLSDAFR